MAKDNNVLIVSQMTLIIVLNMIQMAWRQADQEKNIAEVFKTGEELMSQIRGWLSADEKIGAALNDAQSAFNDASSKLSESNQSVVKKIQKREKLGLASRKSRGKINPGASIPKPESVIPASIYPEGEFEETETTNDSIPEDEN